MLRYEVRSPHRLALTFEEAQIGDVKISPLVEALLAPTILPRTALNQMLLLAIMQVCGVWGVCVSGVCGGGRFAHYTSSRFRV